MMHRAWQIAAVAAGLLIGLPSQAAAGWDLLFFLGRTYPTYDERLSFDLPSPAIPGAAITVNGTPVLDTEGDAVFGVALAAEAGVVGLEGRWDAAAIGFDLTGASYGITGVSGSLAGLTGEILLPDGQFDVERLNLLSLNLRLRTPGPVGIYASGGLTFLPNFEVTGSVPITLQLNGASGEIGVRLAVAPEESEHRFGVNAGGGLRIGGRRVALVGEARVFYFREYELTLVSDAGDEFLNQFLAGFEPVRFRPLIVTAQGGLLFRF
jgi:hypothetical protein